MPRLKSQQVLVAVDKLLKMKVGKNTKQEGSLLHLCQKFGLSVWNGTAQKNKRVLIMLVLQQQLACYWDFDVNDRFDLLDPLPPRHQLR